MPRHNQIIHLFSRVLRDLMWIEKLNAPQWVTQNYNDFQLNRGHLPAHFLLRQDISVISAVKEVNFFIVTGSQSYYRPKSSQVSFYHPRISPTLLALPGFRWVVCDVSSRVKRVVHVMISQNGCLYNSAYTRPAQHQSWLPPSTSTAAAIYSLIASLVGSVSRANKLLWLI